MRALVFSNPKITLAGEADLPRILDILNAAYRGKISEKGWTSETHLIAGEVRTTLAILKETFQMPGSVFLKYTGEDGIISGCVNLQQKPEGIYLGMLAVYPTLQAAGTGRQLMHAAEEFAKAAGCTKIFMTVISVRHELIEWYSRRGYSDTGRREAFEEDGIHGTHLQQMDFAVLEKQL